MASATPSHSSDLRIVLLGKNRAEISAIGNMILGRKAFKEKGRVSEVQRGRVEDRNISVIDTPGFFNTELTDEDLQNEMMKSLSLSHPGPHLFLLIVNPNQFTEDDVRKIVQKIEKNFGAHVLKFTLVLFLRERMSNREWMVLRLSKTCQDLISHFRGKNHEINSYSDTTEITTLLEKLDEVVRQNDDQNYSNENYVFPTIGNREQREKVLVAKKNQRISSHEYKDFRATSKLETKVQGWNAAQDIGPRAKAMFGAPPRYKSNIRTGTAEKNATSNTILGNDLVKEEMSSDVSHHTAEHHTFEMCQELFRNYVEEEEKEKEKKRERERDKLKRTEEQRSREKTQRIREEELKNREEELRTGEDEQREKEEIENLKLINAEMRMIELVRTMSMRRRAKVLAALMAARRTKDQDKNRKQFTFESDEKYQNL